MTNQSIFDAKACGCGPHTCAEDTQCTHDGACRRNPPVMGMLRELHERVKTLEGAKRLIGESPITTAKKALGLDRGSCCRCEDGKLPCVCGMPLPGSVGAERTPDPPK